MFLNQIFFLRAEMAKTINYNGVRNWLNNFSVFKERYKWRGDRKGKWIAKVSLFRVNHRYLSWPWWYLLFSVTTVSDHCLAGTDNCHSNATCASLQGPTFKCACKEERNYFGNGTHCFGKSYRYMWFFSFSPRCSNSRCFIHVFATYVLSLCSFVIFTSEREWVLRIFSPLLFLSMLGLYI